MSRDLKIYAFLEQFLESASAPRDSMNIYQLDGYLRAIACAPGTLAVNDWLPLIFNDLTPAYHNNAHAEEVFNSIEELYRFHEDQCANNLCDLPCSNVYASLQQDRVEIEQWARGFLQGYIICEDQWNNLIESLPRDLQDHKINAKSISEDLDAILSTVSTVADANYALEQGTHCKDLPVFFKQLPDIVCLCGRVGRAVEMDDETTQRKR